MKKTIIAMLLLTSSIAFGQSLTYKLANYSLVSTQIDTSLNKLVITGHVTTKIQQVPYAGAFQQIDYNVKLYVNPNLSAQQISDSIPIWNQKWINEHYISQ